MFMLPALFRKSQRDPRAGPIAPVKSGNTDDPVKNHGDPDGHDAAVDPTGDQITEPDSDHQHGADGNAHGAPDIVHRTQDIRENKGARPQEDPDAVVNQDQIPCQFPGVGIDFAETGQDQRRQCKHQHVPEEVGGVCQFHHLDDIMKNLPEILFSDPEHIQEPFLKKFINYFMSVLFCCGYIYFCFFAYFLIAAAMLFDKKRMAHRSVYLFLSSAVAIATMMLIAKGIVDTYHTAVMMPVLFVGFTSYVLSEKSLKSSFAVCLFSEYCIP